MTDLWDYVSTMMFEDDRIQQGEFTYRDGPMPLGPAIKRGLQNVVMLDPRMSELFLGICEKHDLTPVGQVRLRSYEEDGDRKCSFRSILRAEDPEVKVEYCSESHVATEDQILEALRKSQQAQPTRQTYERVSVKKANKETTVEVQPGQEKMYLFQSKQVPEIEGIVAEML